MPAPQWKTLLDRVMAVPERIYETWNSSDGWDNNTPFGLEFGENSVPWCVIFDWDMYHQAGLAAAVPKVDNVVVFSDWARKHGQWSDYPSVGAWVNFGNGHTELVVGFDADTVYTKGGNSVQAGSTDAGQGNGVWSHATARRSTRVVGYFAPRYPDGTCPPTADPADPRGGKPVTAYRWTGPTITPTTEDNMPEPVDLWAYRNPTQAKANPGMPDAYGYLQQTYSTVRSLTAQIGSLTAAIGALSKSGGLTAEQVTAAAQAGAAAALAELGDALTPKGV